ncbi:MAG: YdeI/OmpD-associated family protein, partial [Firmicutes bacterium]|nr:YdeI/OmpD-associated family protein [Bacillota bacterium]
DGNYKIQRFSPRKSKSGYSQANKERLRWLADKGLIHRSLTEQISHILDEPFAYPEDIIEAIKNDEDAWKNFQQFSEPYKRIRIAFIDAARKRPDEFKKRLKNFFEKTKRNKMIPGYGGIDKYY